MESVRSTQSIRCPYCRGSVYIYENGQVKLKDIPLQKNDCIPTFRLECSRFLFGLFFYSTDESGRSTGSETLWIPYAGVGVVVPLLAIVFFFAPVPDIKAKDDYDIDNKGDAGGRTAAPRKVNRGLSFVLLLGNILAERGAGRDQPLGGAITVFMLLTFSAGGLVVAASRRRAARHA